VPVEVDAARVGHVHDQPHRSAAQPVRRRQRAPELLGTARLVLGEEVADQAPYANLCAVVVLDQAVALSPVGEHRIGGTPGPRIGGRAVLLMQRRR
jgi:hypothetical protein